jgi:hypothetical protein
MSGPETGRFGTAADRERGTPHSGQPTHFAAPGRHALMA